MISTCSYSNYDTDSIKGISISGDKGARANFNGEYYKLLAPKKSFWTIWHNNIGKVSEADNLKYYIEEYYKQVLFNLDPEEVYTSLDNSILLCYEEPEQFCHRHVVAAWFKLFLDIDVNEVKALGYRVVKQNRFDVTNILEEVIKENTELNGFNSIRAFYLSEKAKKYDALASQLEEQGLLSASYRSEACFLESDARLVEEKYKKERKVKVKHE